MYNYNNNNYYNDRLKDFGYNYRALNNFVMTHTVEMCENDKELIKAIDNTINKQYIVYEEGFKKDNRINEETTNIIVTKDRSMEAAKKYKGKKIAVLNFANNHNVGGAPFSAGAQEESICRISTLYPCLQKEDDSFYKKHQDLYEMGKIDYLGNDDLIYSPDIVVFKSDESAPKLLEESEWFKVDVITSAAPVIYYYIPNNYDEIIYSRLEKVFEVAKKENVDVLILGAWGCGAFHNPPERVAKIFKKLLKEYYFETVEFAVFCRDGGIFENYNIFKNVILNES
ncbi:MAG: TIGR02452 family protein [Bacilli bacterium]|nr:TIGR02452 family protein [Bacilli bacterium]